MLRTPTQGGYFTQRIAKGTMTTSEFWQGLESQFRALETSGDIQANWRYLVGSPGRGDWQLHARNHGAELRFELLARRAGAALDATGTDDGLSVWLAVVQSRGRSFHHDGDAYTQNEDGSISHYVLGRVERVCEDSVNLSLTFQVEAEHPNQQSAQPAQAQPVTISEQYGDAESPADPSHRGGEDTGAAAWDAIEISFLSDERVQIRSGTSTETFNYGEMGFEDRRNGKPNRAWLTLRVLAEAGGIVRNAATTGRDWTTVEKRMQELRKALRDHFRVSADPLPFVRGTGYQACFKIRCGPSFRA